MKSLKILGLCLASMLVVGMTLAGTASAAKTLWLLCLEGSNEANAKFEDSSCTKPKEKGKWESVAIGTKSDTVKLLALTILLLDTGATGGQSGVRCGHPTTGWGLVTRNLLLVFTAKAESPKTECERVEGGCKAGEVEVVEGVHLPWKDELLETEVAHTEKVISNLRGDGNGEPGWKVECNTLLGKVADTCTAAAAEPELLNGWSTVTSSVLLVLAAFLQTNKATCTQGGTKTGRVVGLIAILLSSGLGLSLNS